MEAKELLKKYQIPLILVSLSLIIVVGALIYTNIGGKPTKNQQPSASPSGQSPFTPKELPIIFSSENKSYVFVGSIPFNSESTYSDPKYYAANQALAELFDSWGVWKDKGVNSIYLNKDTLTVKKINVHLTTKDQPFFHTPGLVGKEEMMLYSAGEEYNSNNQTLTVLIYIAPALLDKNKDSLNQLSQKANFLFLEMVYQMTHPKAPGKEVADAVNHFLVNELQNQKLFMVVKIEPKKS